MDEKDLVELRNLAEAIERLLYEDYLHISDCFDVGVFKSVADTKKYVEHELEKL
tara:strand:- start:122 stop:283 length:162 start_codon:yes stop_codon:yes gene_type:complete